MGDCPHLGAAFDLFEEEMEKVDELQGFLMSVNNGHLIDSLKFAEAFTKDSNSQVRIGRIRNHLQNCKHRGTPGADKLIKGMDSKLKFLAQERHFQNLELRQLEMALDGASMNLLALAQSFQKG